MRTPRRLQRSARMPDGISRKGTTTAYVAARRPMVAVLNPMWLRNSFSTGAQKLMPRKKPATKSGRRRFRTRVAASASRGRPRAAPAGAESSMRIVMHIETTAGGILIALGGWRVSRVLDGPIIPGRRFEPANVPGNPPRLRP